MRDVSAARGYGCPRFDLARLEGTPDKPHCEIDELLVPFGVYGRTTSTGRQSKCSGATDQPSHGRRGS